MPARRCGGAGMNLHLLIASAYFSSGSSTGHMVSYQIW